MKHAKRLSRFLPVIGLVAILPSLPGARAEVFVTVGARAMGMGGAFVAIANEAPPCTTTRSALPGAHPAGDRRGFLERE